jgi:hypothetical protein
MVSKQDCALWRVIKGRAICKEREGDHDPYNVDYNAPQRMVSEDGVQYAAPLRPSADAPATAWDAAAYKAPPAAPAPPSGPVTAVAETAPEPAPVASPTVSAASPKRAASKPRTRSVKKPSRGPAAPPS